MSVAGDNQAESAAGDAFSWPPRAAPDAPVDSADLDPRGVAEHEPRGRAPRAASRSGTSARGMNPGAAPFMGFERAFLGLHTPPWRIRAAEGGFGADADGAYCPRCAGPVGPHEVLGDAGAAACASCRDERLPWSRAVRLGPWSGVLREAILEAKYARWRRLAFDLGRDLGVVLARRLLEAGVDPDAAAVVPVPMSFRRRWSRGLDHTLEIARGVRSVTGCVIAKPLRRRHRPPQASLAESAREANVRGCFAPRRGPSLAGVPAVVVLDDVRTTGATLRAACRALGARQRRLGEALEPRRVWVAMLAVVTPSNRRVEATDRWAVNAEAEQDSRGEERRLNF